MKKHFLFGKHAINVYKTKGISHIAEIPSDGYNIFTWNNETTTPEDLMDILLPWGEYVEIKEEELVFLKTKSNEYKWRKLFESIDPDDEMNDGEILDFLMANYRVPEILARIKLNQNDYVLYNPEAWEYETFDDGDIVIYTSMSEALAQAKGRSYYAVKCLDLEEEIQQILINQINRIQK